MFLLVLAHLTSLFTFSRSQHLISFTHDCYVKARLSRYSGAFLHEARDHLRSFMEAMQADR